eukprot:TRINITY_DN34153_c0_g1_i1.p1 TRINITY_DN34153_c0_g1~~TRINITY_DN34153_c0_g1_i1.p1  ORF type:complete len:207 (-),score=35.36 TRINITY_DN34153_c0_g1_i1:54-611(-)
MLAAIRQSLCRSVVGADSLGALPPPRSAVATLGGIRGIAKYTRKGIWARGEDGQYTMNDPRIFKHSVERKYPYYKQRQWSKPYMCVRHNAAAPTGMAIKLAISYVPFELAQAYYDLRGRLEAVLPGAKILGDATENLKECKLRVIRLNDGRELFRLDNNQQLQDMTDEDFSRLVEDARDNISWRY